MSKTWSVSELNRYIKDQFEADDVLREVTLSGEIANFKRHGPSGHCYFSLKDAKASLTCVMWRSHVSRLTFSPQDGMTVLVRGQVTVFERNGAYQLYVSRMLAEGAGALAIRFEELKQKLAAEGVFKTAATRRPLPTYPERIALVTSSTGAVIRDMLTVMRRRAPYVQVILAPATVQGSQGAASICAALTALYQREDIDLIIVARGGGSQEDLWNFNEEAVVRTIAASPVPIISAIGHETDVTLADFAADLRAGTPSIAAEQAVPDSADLLAALNNRRRGLGQALLRDVRLARLQLSRACARSSFTDLGKILLPYAQALDERSMLLQQRMTQLVRQSELAFQKRVGPLAALNPLAVMARGFSVATDPDGRIISQARDLPAEAVFNLRMKDGIVAARSLGYTKMETD